MIRVWLFEDRFTSINNKSAYLCDVWYTFDIWLYCGIISVRGGPMFVAFLGNPHPRIYIPTNLNTIIC